MNNPLRKGFDSSKLRESINAHCYMCMGGEKDDEKTRPSIIQLIRECESELCPLNNVRGWK